MRKERGQYGEVKESSMKLGNEILAKPFRVSLTRNIRFVTLFSITFYILVTRT